MADVALLDVIIRSKRARRQAAQTAAAIGGVGVAAGTAAKRVTASTTAMAGGFARLRAGVLSTQSVLLSLGIGLGLVAALKVIKDFEFEMAQLLAISQATDEAFVRLSETARRLGATTVFTAREAAEGMKLLARAGFSADEAMGAVPGTLSLAIAGVTDLGTASQITANIIRSFQMEATKAADIADILADAAVSSNTTVEGLGLAFSFVGGIAKAANQSVSDVAAAIGVLGDTGLDASRAGTGLNRILAILLQRGNKVSKALRRMGLTFEDVNPATNTLVEIMEKLAPLGEKAGKAFEVFGFRGGPAFINLVRNVARLKTLTADVRDFGGEADRIAQIQLATLEGALKLLKSATEELFIQIGDAGLKGGFESLVKTITGVISVFTGMIDKTDEGAEKYERIAEKIRILGVALGTAGLFLALKLATGAALGLAAGLRAATLAAFANPFTALAAVVTVTATALYAARDSLVTFGGETFRVKDGLQVAWNWIKKLKDQVALSFKFIWEWVTDVADSLDLELGMNIKAIGFMLLGMADEAVLAFEMLGGIAGVTAAAVWEAFKYAISEVKQQFKDLWTAIKSGDVKGAWEVVTRNITFEHIDKRLQDDLIDIIKNTPRDRVTQAAVAFGESVGQGAAAGMKKALAEAAALRAAELLARAQKKASEEAEKAAALAAQSVLDAAEKAISVIEDMEAELVVLGIRGEAARLEFEKLKEAELLFAPATDLARKAVEELAAQLYLAKKAAVVLREVEEKSITPLMHYSERVGILNDLLKAGTISQDEYTLAVKRYGKALEDAQDKQDKLNQELAMADMDPFIRGLAQTNLVIGATEKNIERLGADTAKEFGDTLKDVFTGATTAGKGFLDFLGDLGDKILDLAIQEMLVRPLMETLTGVSRPQEDKAGGLFGMFQSVGDFLSQGRPAAGPGDAAGAAAAKNATADAVAAGTQGVVGAVENLTASNETVTEGAATTLMGSLGELGSSIWSGLSSIVGGAASAIGSVDWGGVVSGIGGIFGLGGGAATTAAALSRGGISHLAPRTAQIPLAALAGARRFQFGGSVDNIPALLSRGEAVVPLRGGRAIPVEMKGGEGGGTTVYVNMVVQAQDAPSFRKNQGQMAAELQRRIRAEFSRNA